MTIENHGAVDGDRGLAEMEMTPGELEVFNAIGDGIQKIMAASLSARVTRFLESILQRHRCRAEEGYLELLNKTNWLIRAVVPLVENCDSRGIDRLLGDFDRAASAAAAMTAPQPAMMPGLATFRQFHWSAADAQDLATVLFTPMLGAKKGDIVASIDEQSVTLSSGLRLSKDAIIRACIPANQVR